MRPAYFLQLLLAGLAWQPTYAAPLYKWVDGAGQVTYSSDPPPAGTPAVKVESPPQPSAEDIRQAAERVKRTEEQASEMEDQRRKREAEAAEEARLRALQTPPEPAVVEQPVYLPQPIYYPPVMAPPGRHHDKRRPRPRQVPEQQH